MTEKICTGCQQSKALSHFNRKGSRYFSKCKSCMRVIGRLWEQRNWDRRLGYRRSNYDREKAKGRWLKRYGMTLQDYADLNQTQGGLCAICRKCPLNRRHELGRLLHVDHDHKTNKVRGLLCFRCNAGLGAFGDNLDLLVNACSYLSRPYTGRETNQ